MSAAGNNTCTDCSLGNIYTKCLDCDTILRKNELVYLRCKKCPVKEIKCSYQECDIKFFSGKYSDACDTCKTGNIIEHCIDCNKPFRNLKLIDSRCVQCDSMPIKCSLCDKNYLRQHVHIGIECLMDEVECENCYGICKRCEIGTHCTDSTLIPVSRLHDIVEKYKKLIMDKDVEIKNMSK
jgi:hypothetical protein